MTTDPEMAQFLLLCFALGFGALIFDMIFRGRS